MKSPQLFSFLLMSIAILAFSCAPHPYRKINKDHRKQVKAQIQQITATPAVKKDEADTALVNDLWVGAANFSLRRPNFVIIHHTAQDSLVQTIRTFITRRTQVSSHYVIGKDGTTVQMLNDNLRAWHAGKSKWGNDTDLNSSSIGIELDNNGKEPFSEPQIQSLLKLLKRLKETYNIPTANFLGHADIAPSRKVDPNPFFPWKRLAEEGYGYWHDDFLMEEPGILADSTAYKIETEMLENIPDSFNFKEALRIIGYDVSDLDAAIRAFKIHFIQENIDFGLDENDIRILYNLYQKYL